MLDNNLSCSAFALSQAHEDEVERQKRQLKRDNQSLQNSKNLEKVVTMMNIKLEQNKLDSIENKKQNKKTNIISIVSIGIAVVSLLVSILIAILK